MITIPSGLRLVTPIVLAIYPLAAQNVVSDWNRITTATLASAGRDVDFGPAHAYVSIATYDAVNSIHWEFQPFYFRGSGDRNASDEAAAVAAAHRVLVYYYPSQGPNVDAQFYISLGNIRASVNAKQRGIATGEAAAQALIAARAGDGFEANVPYTPGTAPGEWQPTPPGFLPAATPWLAQMRPFTMRSPDQFLPNGPYKLTSPQWAADYNVTRLFGAADSSVRTPSQTEIGLFWTEYPAHQDSRIWDQLVQTYHLDLLHSARLYAVIWTGVADALIGVFNAKYHYNFWRPVTAIRAGGANEELTADPNWTPLGITPGHPEYPAAHGTTTAAEVTLVTALFGTNKVHVVTDSMAFSDGLHTHVFDDTLDWLSEVYWARIYAGFHFHHSLEDGVDLGRQIAQQLFRENFRPLRNRHELSSSEADTTDR